MELLWLLFALICSWVLSLIRVPILVGCLVAGFAASVLFGVTAPDNLKIVGHWGVLILLFTIGLHIRTKDIFHPVVLGVAATHMTVGTLLFVGITYWLGVPMHLAIFLGVVLSFSSTVLAGSELERRSELMSDYGRMTIGILVVQDVAAACVMLFSNSQIPSWFALPAVLGVVLYRPLLSRLCNKIDGHELMLLFALALIGLGGSAAAVVGLGEELGALICGMLLSGHRRASEITDALSSLKFALLAVFFFSIGMIGWPPLEVWLWLPPLLVILPAKALFFYSLFLLSGQPARSAFLSSASLTSYSEFTLIAGAVAWKQGWIDEPVIQLLALLVVFSFASYIPLYNAVNKLYDRFGHVLITFEPKSARQTDFLKTPLTPWVLVAGFGRVGKAAQARLDALGVESVAIDIDEAIVAERNHASDEDGLFVHGDALDNELLEKLDFSRCKAAIICLPNTLAKTRLAALIAQHQVSPIKTFTYSEDLVEEQRLVAKGVSVVHNMQTELGERLAEQASNINS